MTDFNHGFAPVRPALPLAELDATLHELEHRRTGARLVWLDRDEENKTFGIAFPTLPFDDTGVFHILEHSVLCGSDRYPVKEPFVELLKHSMNTFLNAMTFPDKTLYPISSRNGKDFLNLMRVYLDAVFHPAIYHRPEIFAQEGWHYELDEAGRASYKGVVFNEMKGAFADADELMESAMNRALFPDTPYRYVSGGDPEAIPDLTYERFLESHRTFYAPSNSLIFLDGAVDLETVLRVLDEEYLSGFDRTARTAVPAPQAAVDGGEETVLYEVGSEAEEQGRTRIAWGRVIGSFSGRERLIAAQVLADVLCGSNQAPLSRAILSRGLAENVLLQVVDGVAQPWLRLEARNLKTEDAAEVERVLFDELRRLAAEGIDRVKLEASMARLEFQLRERDFGSLPQGLVFCIQALESWLYGGAPEANLEVGDLFDRLRAKISEGYFEQLLRGLLLENPHRCRVTLIPSRTAGEARRQREEDRLSRAQAGWSEEDRAAVRSRQAALLAWQEQEDTPEQLATLPCLTLEDVDPEPEQLPLRQAQLAGLPVLLHPVNAGGIVYLRLYFDADGCSEEELSQLSFLCRLLGHMATTARSAGEVDDLVRLRCGSLHCYVANFAVPDGRTACRTRLCVSLSALEDRLEDALALVGEILTGTVLSDEDAARDLLRQARMKGMQQVIMSGHAAAFGRLAAQFSACGVADECANGFAAYQWLKRQEERWDWSALRPALEELLSRIVCRSRLTLSVTGEADGIAPAAAEALASVLPEGTACGGCALVPWGVRREGIVIPADIAFACRGGDRGAGEAGLWKLAGHIVSLDYLWNTIRVRGGAYGAGLVVREGGLLSCYSYRDPSGARSLERYLGCADFLRQYCAAGPDLTGAIIGTISDGEPLLTARGKGQMADALYWQGISYAERCRRRKEILEATPEALAALAARLEETLASGGVCIIGGQAQVDACAPEHVLSI